MSIQHHVTRRRFLGAAAATAGGLALPVGRGLRAADADAVSPPAGPIDIGDRKQVFMDGRFLAGARDARIVACAPRKTYERCLSGGLRGYGTILPVDGTFRGFHALSKDGAHWRRVKPGTEPEPDDLVGLYNGQPHPFVDPSAPASQRYKLFSAGSIKASADGNEWETIATRMFPGEAYFPRGMDSLNKCFYDQRLGKYVAYVRVNKAYDAPPEREDYFEGLSKRLTGHGGMYPMRAIGRSVTEDLSSFPMPEVVFEFDENDPHFGGVSVLDFYTPEVNQYREAQEAYFLLTARYRHYEDWYLSDDLSKFSRHSVGGLNAGPLDIGFAASRDGIHWHRYDREPWIPLGRDGSFDSRSMYMCSGMFPHGDEIWMYYVGYDTLHGNPDRSKRRPTMSRVVLTKDRFTAVEADYTGGEFTIPPLRFEGKALHLNINTSAVGLARVEIQDSSGSPIEGYSLDDCDRIHTANTVDHQVSWREGKTDVSGLAGTPVRLRFELQYGAKLHAFRFGG